MVQPDDSGLLRGRSATPPMTLIPMMYLLLLLFEGPSHAEAFQVTSNEWFAAPPGWKKLSSKTLMAQANVLDQYRQQRPHKGGANGGGNVSSRRTGKSTVVFDGHTLPHFGLADARYQADIGGSGWVGVSFAGIFAVFALLGISDLKKFSTMSCEANKRHDEEALSKTSNPASGQTWSALGLLGLQAYRFYSGFNSATWLPYLLAMEGTYLWADNQALFMGVCKLIYGFTILINPIMGRLGDHAVHISHGIGRRLFVRGGITLAVVGIFVCLSASKSGNLLLFLFGITMWRFGEAITDVTTEAIIPEMIAKEQYQMASSLKSILFLSGGLSGYVLLIVLVDLPFDWLYYAYMIGMLLCAFPGMVLLEGAALAKSSAAIRSESFVESMVAAYWAPMQYEGGFPRYALATFVFLLGVSPMFFMLLIVRDLVGVTETVSLQRAFSEVSIVFFLSSAGAAVVTAMGGVQQDAASHMAPAVWLAHKKKRRNHLIAVQIAFGLITLSILSVMYFDTVKTRMKAFFFISSLFGFTFGAGYSLFMEGAWQVLPPDNVGKANAMGFNTMCRLLGVGLGNFLAGVLLEYFVIHDHPGQQVYTTSGYVVMCVTCCCVCFSSAGIVYSMDVEQMGQKQAS